MPENERSSPLIPSPRLEHLATLYDRHAHPIDPEDENLQKWEDEFNSELLKLYEEYGNGFNFYYFKRVAIARCKAILIARNKITSLQPKA